MQKESNRKFAENLRHYMETNGKSASQVARYLGVSRTAITRWTNGSYAPRLDKVDKLCTYFRCTRADLLDQASGRPDYSSVENLTPLETKTLPLIGTIACGKPILAEENIEDRVQVLASINGDFCLRCSGDSMINANISDGDIVVIREQPSVENGEIAAVLIDETETVATLKKVYLKENVLQLVAANVDYEPLFFTDGEISQVRIIGKAVAVIKAL